MSQRRVHVLSDGFRAPNARALLYPLLIHHEALRERGIAVRAFAAPSGSFADCDLLIVDSKHFHGPERGQLAFVQDALTRFGRACEALVWYDTSDSAGWLIGDVLPLVRRYFKSQLLRDRSHYCRPMYGRRAYADFYHRTAGVTDREPEAVAQVTDSRLLDRLQLGWNSGLADYSRWGPARMAAYGRIPLPWLLTRCCPFTRPDVDRPIALSCRMGISYDRDTVAHQRRDVRRRLGQRASVGKVGRGRYFAELRRSRVVVSPFGLGEITLKDFEVFLTGGLLLKPDMRHLETWPDLYRDGETMMAFRWDLEDLETVLEQALDDPEQAQMLAEQGQREYLRYVASSTAASVFAERFAYLIEETFAPAGETTRPAVAETGQAK